MPEDPATERQIAYLRDLGGTAPAGLTKGDASALIGRAQNGWPRAEPHLFARARRLKVDVSREASKQQIYAAILTEMRGRPVAELAAWYAFRVYRNGFDRTAGTGIEDPLDPVFIAIGRSVAADASLSAALTREAQRSESGFRWFGAVKGSDGFTYRGDSVTSIIYRDVSGRLRRSGRLAVERPTGRSHFARADALPVTLADPVERPRRGALPPAAYVGIIVALIGVMFIAAL
nr:hypothetical protein [Mesorhizobium sp.]